jgi:hypothetical protein
MGLFHSLFLRGLNVGRTGEFSDPETSRNVGDIHGDQLATHNHHVGLATNGWPDDSGSKIRDGSPFYLVHPSKGGVAGSLPTTPFGSPESRPNNAAVYYYIKVQ